MGMLMFRNKYRSGKSKDRRLAESKSMEDQIEAARQRMKNGEGRKQTAFANEKQEQKYTKSQKKAKKQHREFLKEIKEERRGSILKRATSEQKNHIKNKKELRQIKEGISYDEYIKSKMWYRKREDFLGNKKDKNCEVCGNAKASQVHHRTYQRLTLEKMSDLTLLCRECHEKFHKVVPSSKMSKAKSNNGDCNCAVCYRRTSERTDREALFEYGGASIICGRCVKIYGEDLSRARWSTYRHL
jgi:ClpP class serine protease